MARHCQRFSTTSARIETDHELLGHVGKVEIVATGFAVESEFEQVVQACLNRAAPIWIRTLDALHLAAALSVGETEFLSNDLRQRAAAVAVGMTVLP